MAVRTPVVLSSRRSLAEAKTAAKAARQSLGNFLGSIVERFLKTKTRSKKAK